jgi:hypothetical protein
MSIATFAQPAATRLALALSLALAAGTAGA